MTSRAMEQKTAVFKPGDLRSDSAVHGRMMDDETRELPLIAGRFAGREWIAEDLRREAEKPRRTEHPRRRIFALALCGALAFLLLIGSLMGQAALTALNDRAVETTAEIRVLREESAGLRVEYAETLDLSDTERTAAETLGMQPMRGEQVVYVLASGEDRAQVLGIRKGHQTAYFWNTLVDTLGECFH